MTRPTVAILGASADRGKFGNKSLRAHAQQGWDVFPVNPRGGIMEGREVYATLAEVPVGQLDRVSVYLPPRVLEPLLPSIAEKGCGQLWLNPGSDSPEVVAKSRELGIETIVGCSIIDVGVSPSDFP